MPRRPWATAFGRNAQNRARSASIWSRWRLVMHRSSESVAAIATALAKAQTELSNPEKAMIGMVYNARTGEPAELPVRLPIERAGHHQKGPWRSADRSHADHRYRQGQRNRQSHHSPRPHFWRMDFFGLAGLQAIGDRSTAQDGGGADLRSALRAVHDGG